MYATLRIIHIISKTQHVLMTLLGLTFSLKLYR